MNADLVGHAGILILKTLVMQRIKSECDYCLREYSLELMIDGYCIRCFNKGSRHVVDKPSLKVLEGTGLREKGTGLKFHTAFSKAQGSRSRKNGDVSSSKGGGHDK